MKTLYACLESGNCYKPWLLMNQLGQPFDLRLIDVLKGEQKTREYLAVNPLGVVPFLQVKPGHGIGESNAMLWYLAEGSPLMPGSRAERAEALQWMFFEQSKLEPFISPARFHTTILPTQRETMASQIASWRTGAETGLFRLDAHLSTRKFMLSSGYTIADIAVFGYVHLLEQAGLRMADFPEIGRWTVDVMRTTGYRPLADMGRRKAQAA